MIYNGVFPSAFLVYIHTRAIFLPFLIMRDILHALYARMTVLVTVFLLIFPHFLFLFFIFIFSLCMLRRAFWKHHCIRNGVCFFFVYIKTIMMDD